MNILKPKPKLFRIYPLFHFVPGDPQCQTAIRRDGKMHWLNTTPDSSNANRILDAALETGNLYRIGIACHSYADTWAHQNFVGYYDEFNAMAGPLSTITPNIGHADAQHNPDWPALAWRDPRLKDGRRNNKPVFIEAAACVLQKLARYTDGNNRSDTLAGETTDLKHDLDGIIGERDQSNRNKEDRIERCRRKINESIGQQIREYDADDWIEEALREEIRGLRDRSDFTLARWDPWTDVYSWRDPDDYRDSDWYQFQEAVKGHQNASWNILREANFNGLDLPEM